MEGRFRFYTYGKTLELNGVPYEAGRIAEDILNMSRERYLALFDVVTEVQKLSKEYEANGDVAVWWKLNNLMVGLCHSLREYLVFRHLLGEEEEVYFNAVMEATGQLCLFPPVKLPEPDAALDELAMEVGRELLTLNVADEVPPPELPWQEQDSSLETPFVPLLTHAMLLEHYGVSDAAWEEYKKVIGRFQLYLLDTCAFVMSIRNFINLLLPRAERNDPESYTECLYAYYTDDRLIQKLMVDPLQNYGVGYTMEDKYVLSYVPRLLPDDTAVIAQEHITDGIQAVLKADYMLALNSGHQIRRCLVCGRYFLLTSGVHALYCEGACPHAPRFTCRQFGTHEAQKELAKDVPKIRAKMQSFERIHKDMQRGNITREDARKAKDYVRDQLYDALRDSSYHWRRSRNRSVRSASTVPAGSGGSINSGGVRGKRRRKKHEQRGTDAPLRRGGDVSAFGELCEQNMALVSSRARLIAGEYGKKKRSPSWRAKGCSPLPSASAAGDMTSRRAS